MREMSEKFGRRAARVAGVAAITMLVTALSSPVAHAVRRDDGDDPGSGLSAFETLGLFVLTPLLLFAVIAGLVTLADRRSRAARR